MKNKFILVETVTGEPVWNRADRALDIPDAGLSVFSSIEEARTAAEKYSSDFEVSVQIFGVVDTTQ